MPFPCRSANGLDWVSFDLHSAAVFDSQIPCRSPAMPRIRRSESDLSRQRQVRGRGSAWERHCIVNLHLPSRDGMWATYPRSALSENGRVVAGERHGMCESALRGREGFNLRDSKFRRLHEDAIVICNAGKSNHMLQLQQTRKQINLFGFEDHTVNLSVWPFNPLTPELNPSAQRCLPRVFTGDFNI
jgi:hypothetical protein